jgi:hypothetical protein
MLPMFTDMDLRQHERLKTQLEVRVVDLTWDEPAVRGEMVDVSSAGVCVVLPSEMAHGDTVRVDFSEGSLFGQVVHVTPGQGGFVTGVEVFDVLLGTSDLARLVQNALRPDPEEAPVRQDSTANG